MPALSELIYQSIISFRVWLIYFLQIVDILCVFEILEGMPTIKDSRNQKMPFPADPRKAYDVMKRGLGLSAKEMGDVFAEWNKGVLDSFLIEITRDIVSV